MKEPGELDAIDLGDLLRHTNAWMVPISLAFYLVELAEMRGGLRGGNVSDYRPKFEQLIRDAYEAGRIQGQGEGRSWAERDDRAGGG